MLSRLIQYAFSFPTMLLTKQLVHHRCTDFGPLVLEILLALFTTKSEDMGRTGLHRTEPNSSVTLMGEHPNPWHLLQYQDVTSRHRCDKRHIWYELAYDIVLLSLG